MSIVHQRALPGITYRSEELSTAWRQSEADLLAALELPVRGEIYDLDAGRWPGMPMLPVHPPFELEAFRLPPRDAGGSAPTDEGDAIGVITEVISGSAHTGAHVDALCHVTSGPSWFGGGNEHEHLNCSGALRAEASSMPPFVRRGVLVDVAGLHGTDALPRGYAITPDDIDAALGNQDLEVRSGDAVLVRTGYMGAWGSDPLVQAEHYGAGLGLDAAVALADAGAVFIGTDTENLEAVPAIGEPVTLPVHAELMTRRGLYLGELLFLDQLAAAGAGAFLFVCLPLRIRGASGSMVRPIGVV